ncbi:MAG TPA: hypothetical protein EYG89_06735 [Bacteroidia bacterium]|nr:hypothetical protein [Bacteroidia bacterium]
MKFINKYNKDKVLYFLLSLVLITLPFPSYSLNSKMIILLTVYWLFYNSLDKKIKILKQNKHSLFLFVALFLMLLFSILFSDNYSKGFLLLGKKIVFILLPLIIFTIKNKKNDVNFLLHYFSISVVISSFFALIKVLYFKINNIGDYLSYSSFALFLNKHTTYFALFTTIAILYFINRLLTNKKNIFLQIIVIVYLLLILYFLSVRISIIALIISTFILLSKANKRYIVSSIFLLGILFFISPSFQKRFHSIKGKSTFYDIHYRYKHWKINVDEVMKKNILFGYGLGSNRKEIYQSYKDQNLTSAYKEKYNAHNQFLEYYVHAGLIGFLIFLFINFMLIKKIIQKQSLLYPSIYSLFLIFMLTESILERHSGMVLFSILIPLFIAEKTE